MNPEKIKRRQSFKIIVSETIMVVAVILTVIILALLVSGYWINSDFKVERQGLLQISSVPTGADVYIDGSSSWLQRTNTSKVLPSGEHTITLTKDGYDSWSKTINISEGLLYRLHYPRLFLLDRTAEEILNVPGTTLATISPDHNSLLLVNNTTEWTYINLDTDNIEPKAIDISQLFSSVSLADNAEKGLFTGQILDTHWDYDGSHVLFKTQSPENITEWVLLDIKNVAKSVNITREFGNNFSEIQILDNSSNNLLAIQNGNLHKIDISNKSLSAVLVESVINFDHYNNEIVFSAANLTESDAPNYYIGYFKIGDSNIAKLQNTTTQAKTTLSRFYEDKYITVLEDTTVSLYQKEDFKLIDTFNLSFIPNTIEVGHDGEFITMSLDSQIATLDMEALAVTEWQTASTNYGWIDNDMVYSVENNSLSVYDYDGLNHRVIANNASPYFPAAITNNKWLYYFNNDTLIREVITD